MPPRPATQTPLPAASPQAADESATMPSLGAGGMPGRAGLPLPLANKGRDGNGAAGGRVSPGGQGEPAQTFAGVASGCNGVVTGSSATGGLPGADAGADTTGASGVVHSFRTGNALVCGPASFAEPPTVRKPNPATGKPLGRRRGKQSAGNARKRRGVFEPSALELTGAAAAPDGDADKRARTALAAAGKADGAKMLPSGETGLQRLAGGLCGHSALPRQRALDLKAQLDAAMHSACSQADADFVGALLAQIGAAYRLGLVESRNRLCRLGLSGNQASIILGHPNPTLHKWCVAYRRHGFAGLVAGQAGRPRKGWAA